MLSMKGENYIRGKRAVILAFLESYMFKPSMRWTRFGEPGGLTNSVFELWSGRRPVGWRRENSNVRRVELSGGAMGLELIPPNGNKCAGVRSAEFGARSAISIDPERTVRRGKHAELQYFLRGREQSSSHG